MIVLLCGAADIKTIVSSFKTTIASMGFDPKEFITGTSPANNFSNWGENSMEAVTRADIIVFVLISKAGDITWNVEYETAVRLGKPYILLCEEELASLYFTTREDPLVKVTSKHKLHKAMKVLDLLIEQQRSIIRFSISDNNFSKVLLGRMTIELESAVKKLEEYYKNRGLLLLIRDKNYKQLMFNNLTNSQIQYFENVLMDVFEHKEIRKRIIYFFSIHKYLSDEQIIALIDDPEQGIAREVVDHLPALVSDKNNKEKIISALISTLDGSTESGTIRRAINSILNLDFKIGINYIDKIPAYDIGTPRRILGWIDENFSSLSPYLLDNKLKEKTKNVVQSGKDFLQTTKKLNALADKLLKLIDDDGSDSKISDDENEKSGDKNDESDKNENSDDQTEKL